MKNKNDIKLTPLELESLRSELIEKTLRTSSNNLRLFLYQNYFEKILSLNNPNLDEAFLKEFLDDYTSCICKFEVWGVEPDITKKLLEQLKKVSSLYIASESLPSLNSEIERIEKQTEILNLILEGKDFADGETHKAFFPLIDKEAPKNFYGIIESVTVRISKAFENDKFIVVPSEKEIEKKILEQCKKSWSVALELSKKFIKKTSKHHEVIISFDKKEGFYEGNSLGIALTLSFLERLLKIYNPVYIINIKEQSAFTGGVTETGEVLCTSEEIIKRKVAAIFFSETTTFVFPKREETYAYFALIQLKKSYPNRKLKLIPIEDINDVINRRDVVDIKKQKLVVRSGKFVKKNWISAVATVLLAILFANFFVMDFDDNPYLFSSDGQFLFFKNKNGKVLIRKYYPVAESERNNQIVLGTFIKILDVNNDGRNEILLRNNRSILSFNGKYGATCYDSKGVPVWTHSFNDQVTSQRENLNREYEISFLDTITIEDNKNLIVRTSNTQSFSSAIYRIDLRTGNRIPGTLWTSGFTVDGMIKDINNDGKKDILALGYDNGYEDAVLFGFEIDSLTKTRMTSEEYLIRNYPIGNMIIYIRIPKADFDINNGHRMPALMTGSLKYNYLKKFYSFSIASPDIKGHSNISYYFDENFKIRDVDIGSDFRVQRDSLVAHGRLDPPFTDTEEYKKIIIDKILYWNNNKWVKRSEFD